MPRWFLSERNEGIVELMDDPDCDPAKLAKTYAWFARLNPWLGRWRTWYHARIRPALPTDRPARILDIGCGGADVLRLIGDMARRDGFSVELTGIDPDERAIQYARRARGDRAMNLRQVHSSQLIAEGSSFDIVLSNHVLHHLDEARLQQLLSDSDALAERLVLHNDICRDDLAWAAFWPVGAIPALNSFILTDGLRSIRRAWHPDEVRPMLPAGWSAETVVPFRMLLTRGT